MLSWPSIRSRLRGFDKLDSGWYNQSIKVNASAVTFQVTVSSIGTNVVVRFEGSLDDTNFFNLDDEDEDTTISTSGTTGYSLSGTPVEYVRLRLVSITGGTPTVATVVGAL